MQRTLSMRRLAAVTLVVFVLMLAFLAGRVRAGADPAQSSTPASSPATQSTPPATTPITPDGSSADPYGTLPGSGGSADPYGTGPDNGGSADPYGTAPNDGGSLNPAPDAGPPVTHAS